MISKEATKSHLLYIFTLIRFNLILTINVLLCTQSCRNTKGSYDMIFAYW